MQIYAGQADLVLSESTIGCLLGIAQKELSA